MLIDWLIDWFIGWLNDWLIGWLNDWLIDWLTDSLIDWYPHVNPHVLVLFLLNIPVSITSDLHGICHPWQGTSRASSLAARSPHLWCSQALCSPSSRTPPAVRPQTGLVFQAELAIFRYKHLHCVRRQEQLRMTNKKYDSMTSKKLSQSPTIVISLKQKKWSPSSIPWDQPPTKKWFLPKKHGCAWLVQSRKRFPFLGYGDVS